MTLAINETAPDFEAETTEGWKAPEPYLRIVPQPKA